MGEVRESNLLLVQKEIQEGRRSDLQRCFFSPYNFDLKRVGRTQALWSNYCLVEDTGNPEFEHDKSCPSTLSPLLSTT